MESISKILYFSSGVVIHMKTLQLRFLPDEAHLKYVNKHINRHLKEGENHSLVYKQMCLKQEQLFKKELPHDKINYLQVGDEDNPTQGRDHSLTLIIAYKVLKIVFYIILIYSQSLHLLCFRIRKDIQYNKCFSKTKYQLHIFYDI